MTYTIPGSTINVPQTYGTQAQNNQYLGNVVDAAATAATSPIKLISGLTTGNWNPVDFGLSEAIAGGPTKFSTQTITPAQTPAPFDPNGYIPGYRAPGASDTNTNGTGIAGNYASPATLAQYDQAIGIYNNSLGRLSGQLDIAKGNINQQYGTNLNELDSTKNQAQNNYNTSTTQNGQSLRTNKNVIADQASSGLRGLLRTLGAYGASGSSDALYNAPQAVANQATQQRAGAGQTFAQNQQGLDTNWGNFTNQDANSHRKLNDWQSNQLNSVQATSDTTKQDLLTKLAGIASQRASAAGGNATASAQPYLDQAAGLNSTIDNLGRNVASYTGTTPVYQAPTLDSYNTGAGTAGKIDPTTSGGATSPYLAMLLGQNKDKLNARV